MSAPWENPPVTWEAAATDDHGEPAVWTECDDCRRWAWCLREENGLTYCADGKTCQRRLRRQPRYWLGWCRMRWRELVTYPQEARRPQLPAPWEQDVPPWAQDAGDDR